MKKVLIFAAGFLILVLALVFSLGAITTVTPSTNDINRTNGWAHVDQVSVGVGEVTLEFISTRGFASCFEYRTDGDTSQVIGVNYNTDITDGLYPFYCQNNNSSIHTISANEYVEVRMVFGAERDERFDWTRTCEGGASDVSGETFGFVVMNINGKGDLIIVVSLKGATPNETYDIWVNQNPGACPLGSPTVPAGLTTNGKGNGNAKVKLDAVDGARNFWVSAVGGGQVLRSVAVELR